MAISKRAPALRVKCAGGAAAQALALMDAIYASQHTNRQFIFEFYPSGTGTFWPFEIDSLLKPHERPESFSLSRGHTETASALGAGKIDPSHPVNSKRVSFESFLIFVRKLNLDQILLALRGEIPIKASKRQLDKVSIKTKTISGGFFPIQDSSVLNELHERFIESELTSPFDKTRGIDSNYDVVIHYRLGDKRAKYTNPKVVGGDGVIDPQVFANQIHELKISGQRFLVLSDDPGLAQELLCEVGISAEILSKSNDVWEDLNLMAQAKIFIGSWSQVSQFAAACVLHNGGKAYLPSEESGKNSLTWSLDGLVKYKPEFLPEHHPIYFKNVT